MSLCCVLGLKPRYSHCTSFHPGPGRSKLGSDNPESVRNLILNSKASTKKIKHYYFFLDFDYWMP